MSELNFLKLLHLTIWKQITLIDSEICKYYHNYQMKYKNYIKKENKFYYKLFEKTNEKENSK